MAGDGKRGRGGDKGGKRKYPQWVRPGVGRDEVAQDAPMEEEREN